jgi:hypothetical protein
MNNKILIIIIVGLFICINQNPIQSAEIENKFYNPEKIDNSIERSIPRIRLGFIAVTTDGTKSGSSVIVDAQDWNLRDYYSRIVCFYIDYSIVNGGPDDYVNIEINMEKNDSDWDQISYKISNDYIKGEINFENVNINQGDNYNIHIKATYINNDPSIIISDEDVSSLALTNFNFFRLFRMLNFLLHL